MAISDYALIGVAVLVLVGAVVGMLVYQKTSKLSKNARRAAAEKRFNTIYRFLVSFPLTQGRVNAISRVLSDLSVYKSGEISTITVKYFGMATALQAGIIVFGLMMFHDIFSWLSCVIVALFAGHIVIDRQLEKLNLRVYKQMAMLLSVTRQEYLRFGSIPEALNNISPPPLMAGAAAEIEDILTNSDGELRLMKFYESVPFRLLQTFATICYNVNNTGDEIVASISRGQGIPDDDRTPIVESIYTRWWGFKQFILNITPKNATRRALQQKLDAALSRKTPETYTAERFMLSVIGAIVCIALLFSSLHYGRKYLMDSTESMGMTADESLDGYPHELVLAMDNEYLAYCEERGDEMVYNEALVFVANHLPGLSEMEVGDQVKRLQDKRKALAGTEIAWWHFLIVGALTVGLYFVPAGMLKIRRWGADNAAEEDFLQLQSLMAIIAAMGMDTIEALEQLQTNSRIHRHLLLYCYHAYPANPEIELERLKTKVALPGFKRFIDKMKLTVADLSLSEAYSDLTLEREHLVRMREMATTEAIGRQRNIAGMAAKAPMGCMVICHAVLPLAYLGINEMGAALGGLGNL